MHLFVDRVDEIGRFRQLLSGDSPALFLVNGGTGTGKTSLLHQYRACCLESGVPYAMLRLDKINSISDLLSATVEKLDLDAVTRERIITGLRQLPKPEVEPPPAQGYPGKVPSGALEPKNVLNLLETAFESASRLRRFCQDHMELRRILLDSPEYISHSELADRVHKFCETHVLLSQLLKWVEEYNSPGYALWISKIQTQEEPRQLFSWSFFREHAETVVNGLQGCTASRIVLLFDRFDAEAVRPELRRWFVNTLLDCLHKDPRFVVVVAVCDEAHFSDDLQEFHFEWQFVRQTLAGIELGDWLHWADNASLPNYTTNIVKYIYYRHRGDPRETVNRLTELKTWCDQGLFQRDIEGYLK